MSVIVGHIECQSPVNSEHRMGKACCAPGCVNRYSKGNGIKFYRFPVNLDRRRLWIAALNRKDWQPSEYSWLCSDHFVTGEKNDDPNHPDYVPNQFAFLKSPVKAKVKRDLIRYHRFEEMKVKRLKSTVSPTGSIVDGEDTEDPNSDDQEPNDTSAAWVVSSSASCDSFGILASSGSSLYCDSNLLELQHRDDPGRVGVLGGSWDADEDTTQIVSSSASRDSFGVLASSGSSLCCGSNKLGSQHRDGPDEVGVLDGSQDAGEDTTQQLPSSSDETDSDLCVAEPFINDHIPEEPTVQNDWLQTNRKDTGEKGVQVDYTHLEFNEQSLQNDDKKVNFYTGLPNYATLKLVTELVTSGVEPNRGVLTAFQEICLVLIKLRLNLEEQDLAYRFGISQPTVSRVFRKWMVIMGERLRPLIYWPERAELKQTMPVAFRKFFPKCACILDCTEVFIERPSDLKARAQTWSNYKQHNTVKILIAITPQGSISFVSKAWGGRVSDKYITEHSGILEKLLPGDLVLADRGFTIQDSVGFYCAEVKTPPFTKGRKQLSRHEVDWSREISHVRIHVERVIGVLKQKYTILQGTIPITMLKDGTDSTIDNIIITCSALCNLCVSTVPLD